MRWIYSGILVVLVLLLNSCGGIQRLPAYPTEEADHDLAIIEPAAGTPAASDSADVSQIYIPLARFPAPARTPTQPPPTGGKQPVGGGHTFPPYSTSLYIKNIDGSNMYNMGCEVGLKDLNTAGTQDSLVILAFGYPKYMNGQYGTRLFGLLGPVTVEQISFAAKQFAWGYYTCTGTDFDSHLRVGIGTSNYEGTDAAVNFGHGAAWARMVNEVNSWLIENGASGQVDVVGANDIELSWNTYVKSKDWLDGYDSVNQYDLYNFGALPGCPSLKRVGATCGSYPYIWTYEQVWYVIYGAGPVYPLPEIYLNSGVNAEQWYMMSVFSVENHGTPVSFVGSLTTYQACLQFPGDECLYIDNTPREGWTQLYNLLNGDSRTAQGLRWASDMKWTSATVSGSAADAAAVETLTAGEPVAMSLEAVNTLQASLQAGGLSDTMRLGLQDKLQAAQWAESMREQGARNPAPKNEASAQAMAASTPMPPQEVQEQIIEGSEGLVQPALAAIQNLWVGMLDGEEIQALAGAMGEDPDQGLLIIMSSQPGQVDLQVASFLPPAGAGPLRIVERQGSELVLQTASGGTLRFDLLNRQFK